ncbi:MULTISPECIES: tyrosine-type recombinase/integrase [Streptomyces]|uniref:Site-specific integrase n=2 Tax=Streptomyces TaxID=1883 RepID=A0A3R7J2M9_9ACTN|nr:MULTISPECIES: integrase [Streptomyces]KNE79657.1 integrase [Streptomyces fradiae]OFA37727.1 integrase [Streptomyces fradiae]PQM23194.1 site-specific integrase [Streptomyces xinghaiensis]RKM94754.1 site-specific integrase [Streptomyces xinghaiensis]RNC74804.1 site-specific integrase [Streptomyces xinghaiensis]
MLTYDVEIWNIRTRKSRPKPYMLRWRVGTREHSKSYVTKGQAEGRQTQLRAALRKREQFDTETGFPESELRALNAPTWYEHARDYVVMKWPRVAAKHRASIAESLAVVTAVLVSESKGSTPDPLLLRRALLLWAFRLAKDSEGNPVPRLETETPPAEIETALAWVTKHSLPIEEAARPMHLRQALDALARRLDGRPAADNTVRRKRAVLSNCLAYAVERDLLATHPLPRVDWETPRTDDEIDFRYVPGPALAKALIDAVRTQGPRGEHLEAFFGCFYYAAMRPGEISALKAADCVLPKTDTEWGELILEESRPEVGSGWTDDGTSYEKRGLKRRARKATRPVPIPPVLVGMLRTHLATHGTAPDGRLFRAVRGGRVRSTEYCELWEKAREKALSPEEARTSLADVPYSLRHAGISLWLKAGVDPVEVARRAGHSLAVLYRFYAKVLRGAQQSSNHLIDVALAGLEADPDN